MKDKDLSEIDHLIFSAESGDMKYFPSNIGTLLSNLKYIEGHKTNLSFLKRNQFKFMRKVGTIDISSNQISSIDEDSFYDLPSLTILFLEGNKIKSLQPKLLHKSKKLEIFSVSENQIEVIPKDFFINNKKLKYVDFSENKLKTILVDFTKMKQLPQLNLKENVCINQTIGNLFAISIGRLYDDTEIADIQDVINSNCTARN